MRELERLQRLQQLLAGRPGLAGGLLVVLVLGMMGGWPVGGQPPERSYTIQVASVATVAEARQWLEDLKRKGIAAYTVQVAVPGLGMRYRIRYGRFRTAQLAKAAAEREVGRGVYRDFIVSREEGEPVRQPPVEKRPGPERLPPSPVGVTPTRPVMGGQTAEKGRVATEPERQTEPPAARSTTTPVGSGKAEVAPARRTVRSLPALPELVVVRNRWEALIARSLPAEKWRAIEFIDQLTGWLGGENGTLYRTNDGGRTWSPVEIETRASVISIDFLDWNRGWVLTGDGVAASELWLTWTGGRSWRRASLPGIEKVWRVDARTGWATGGASLLMRTVDGGENWLRVTGVPAGIDLVDLDAGGGTGGKTVWVVANQGTGDERQPSTILKSVDGGRRWSEVPLPGELLDQTGRRRRGRFLSVSFQTPQSGLITGELVEKDGRAWFTLETGDGGQSWRLALQSGRELERARFILAGGGIPGQRDAGGMIGWTQTATIEADQSGGTSHIESHLMVTVDGGRTWHEEFRLLGRHNLLATFRRPGEGWAITENGVLLISRGPGVGN
jgi:photosystem II stability/assembly factor-like uncharacterized protein